MDILAQYNDSDCEHERITPAEADSCSSNEDEEAEAMDLDLREEAEGALDDLAYAAGYADVDVVEGADAGLQIPMLLPEAASREDSDSEDGSDYESDGSAASKNLRSKWADLLTEEEAESFAVGPPRSKHELDPDSEAALLAPTVSTIVTGPCSSLQAAGEVVYFIQQEGTLVIRALRPGLPHAPCTPGLATLNEGSLLCDEHGNVLGAVQEVFGPVADPFYLVRVPSATPSSFEGVHDRTVPTTGQIVYTASEHATFLSAAELLRARAKGSDASNAFDEEPGAEELEYSDDEQEQAARQIAKGSRKRTKGSIMGGSGAPSIASSSSNAAVAFSVTPSAWGVSMSPQPQPYAYGSQFRQQQQHSYAHTPAYPHGPQPLYPMPMYHQQQHYAGAAGPFTTTGMHSQQQTAPAPPPYPTAPYPYPHPRT